MQQLCDEKYYHVVHNSWHIPQFEPSEWERQAEHQQSQQLVQSVTVITDLAKHGVTGVAIFQKFNSFRHEMKKRSSICFKSSTPRGPQKRILSPKYISNIINAKLKSYTIMLQIEILRHQLNWTIDHELSLKT